MKKAKILIHHPILLSISVHALLVIGALFAQFEHRSGAVSVLQVELGTEVLPQTVSKVNSVKSDLPVVPKQNSDESSTQDSLPQVAAAAQTSTSVQSGGPSSAAIASEMSSYISKVTALINQNKRYPRMALLREEQGDVMVSFDVAHDGQISNPKVEKACVFDALNKGALETISTLGRLPPLPEAMSLGAHLHIPLQYRLRH